MYFDKRTIHPNTTILLALIISVSIFTPSSFAETCERAASATADIRIYDNVPKFSKAQGWVFGQSLGLIKQSSRFFICKESNIGFGGKTEVWYKIAFWGDGDGWSYGWIRSDKVEVTVNTNPFNISLFASVMAQSFSSPPESADIPRAPTDIGEISNELGNLPGSGLLYLYLFVALLAGMAAKIVYDITHCDSGVPVKVHLKRGIGNLVLAPIVFMSLFSTLGAGIQFEGNKTLIMLMFFAFQNGFFCHDTLRVIQSMGTARAQPQAV